MSDFIAAISIGLVTLPLAVAIAIASGLPPQTGLYCAIVAGLLMPAVGKSSIQICGPAAAFVMLVYGIVSRCGTDGLSTCTLMAGAMLVVLGVTGLGAAVKFIPSPVVLGFKNGIALMVISTQVKDLLGIRITSVPEELWARIEVLAKHFRGVSVAETGLSAATLALVFLSMRYAKKLPAYGIVLMVGTALTIILKLPVETIAGRFGPIRSGFPAIAIPHFRPELLSSLVSPAIAIAMLSAILSLASPVTLDHIRGNKRDSNLKLVRQGFANSVSAFFGGLPAAGAMAQGDTNAHSDAKTSLAGILHAFLLLLFLLFAAPLAGFIPLSVLAAILLLAACRMGEWHEIPKLLKLSKLEIAVWLMTCLLTVFADLTVAVEAGMILALLMFIRKVTTKPVVNVIRKQHISEGHAIQ